MSNTERMATEIMQSPRFKAELMKLDSCPIFGAFSAEVMEMVRAKQISQSEAAEEAEKNRALQIKNKIDEIEFKREIESEELKGFFMAGIPKAVATDKPPTEAQKISRNELRKGASSKAACYEWNGHRPIRTK